MIFTQDIVSDLPLNTYNNNIIEFKATDEVKTVFNAIITIDGSDFELTPNLDNIFRFNFKHIAKVLNNLNNFKDEIEPELNDSVVYSDENLFNEIEATVKISFTDETDETEIKTYQFLKSVSQIMSEKRYSDSRLFLLSEFKSLTYFEGYPFDFSVYSDIDREIKIKNKGTQQEITLNVTKGVNRLFISDGRLNLSLINLLPIFVGYNELEFYIENEFVFNLLIRKIDAECGVYIKWFNRSGSFSYWLLPDKYRNDLSTRTIDELINDFENLENSQGNINITGKTAAASIDVVSQAISNSEYKHLLEVLTSPKVQIYKNERYFYKNLKDWIDVKISDGRNSFGSKRIGDYLPLRIELPNLITQTL